MDEDIKRLLKEQEAKITQRFVADRKEIEAKMDEEISLDEWVGVNASDGKGIVRDADGNYQRGEIITSGQILLGERVLNLSSEGGRSTLNSMPTNYRDNERRRFYYPRIIPGKIAILAEVIYEGEDPIACSCIATRYIALTVETKRRFITMLLLDEKVMEIKASVAVLYKFIQAEATPPEEPCGGCTIWYREGNTCRPRCIPENRNGFPSYGSLESCLTAPEPAWPDPNTRYPALYLWADAIDLLEFERIECEVLCNQALLYVNPGHIIESQVLAWTEGAYQLNKPIAPSFYGGYEYRIVTGGTYGGFRLISANGWLGMSFTIFVYDSNNNFIKEVPCWSVYKEVLGGTYELPSSTVYFPFSNIPYSQSITWEKVFRADDEICSPFNDVPRGQPAQERPHRDNRYINFYLGGDRQPTLIQKIHISERYSAYVVKTDDDSAVVGIRIGQQEGSDQYCSISYSEVSAAISKQKVAYPELPTQATGDWWHPYLNYEVSLPSYPNPIEQPYSRDINFIFLNSESLNQYYKLGFDPQQAVKLESGESEAMYFFNAFKRDRKITRAVICVNGIKGLLINEIIPANKNILTLPDIVAISPYFPPQNIEEEYGKSTLSCTATIVYRAEIIESWFSGYQQVVYSHGYFNFATSSVASGTFTGYGCNGEIITIVNSQFNGFLSYRNQSPYRLCE